MKIVLASTSPYRRELFARFGLPFRQLAPGVDESPQAGEPPSALAARLSEAKARALAQRCPDSLIIGSDQAAVCGSLTLGKPGDFTTACDQLRHLSGRTAHFYTAVTVLNVTTGKAASQTVITEVVFRALTAAEIERYLEREQPYDCAGSFKAEGLGIALFEALRSDDPTALVGLPLIALRALLAEFGVDVITDGR
ncbi:MAG: nucleoside triphosphate pyrophosphatase [Porticoccaceae bacterium]